MSFDLYRNLRRDSGADWEAYVGHDFVTQLASGTLPWEEFVAWMVQDYLYLVHYARAYAILAYKETSLDGMRSAAGILHGLLDTEMSLHRQYLREVGIGEAELEATEETLETLAYGRYILDRALAGDALDLMVTLAPCLAGYGEIGRRLLADPETRIDGNRYRDWIETYGGETYNALAEAGLARLQACADLLGGEARFPSLLKEFRQVVKLETRFWEAGRSALHRARAGGRSVAP